MKSFLALGFDLDSNVLAQTKWSYVYSGYYTYGSTIKIASEMTRASIGVKVTVDITESGCKNTCTHEMGHALGFTGYTLQALEKNHLAQVYIQSR